MKAGPLFFLGAVANIVLKLATTATHGLLAINWLLAGEEAGLSLVASLTVVFIHTYLLVEIALIAHLRAVVIKVARVESVRVKFQHITGLPGTPMGKVYLAIHGAAMLVLVVQLRSQKARLMPWLGTAAGVLMWANATLKSVGATEWDELKWTVDSSPVVSATEFLESLTSNTEEQVQGPENDAADAAASVGGDGHRLHVFTMEDEALRRKRQALMCHVFPGSIWCRRLHAWLVSFFALQCALLPMALVVYCATRVPRLQAIEVSGGSLHPNFRPKKGNQYYILPQEGWEHLVMRFELGQGQASTFGFHCKTQNWQLEEQELSEQLRLKVEVPLIKFGTCALWLQGLRANVYTFTLLSLEDLHAHTVPEAHVMPFQAFSVGKRQYKAQMLQTDASDFQLALTVVAPYDSEFISMKYEGSLCHSEGSCVSANVSSDPTDSREILAKINTSEAHAELVLTMQLVPKSKLTDVTCNYTVQVDVLDVKGELQRLVQQISVLQAQKETSQDLESALEANRDAVVQNLTGQLELAIKKRNELLERAYHMQPVNGALPGTLNILAVGLTGTGKSELCLWMTRSSNCSSSDSMESHTSEVVLATSNPFGDAKMKPMIEWIDTPGRGDTRGSDRDKELWNETMELILKRDSGQKIDRIVWVINAASQRGTAARELMFRELRRSFGVHLFQHLSIVLNYLPHSPNKSAYQGAMARQRHKFTQWFLKLEDEMFHWPEELREGIEQELNNVQMYGVSINPAYLKEVPRNLPLSAPYLEWFQPFSHPAGLSELLKLYEDVRAEHKKKAPLTLRNRYPRIGFGVMESAESSRSVTCRWVPPHEETISDFQWELVVHLRGRNFLNQDRAVLIPPAAECGDPEATGWGEWRSKVVAAVPGNRSSSEALYRWLLPEPLKKEIRLCFCETPACNQSWRFGQKQDLSLSEPEPCVQQIPLPEIPWKEAAELLGAGPAPTTTRDFWKMISLLQARESGGFYGHAQDNGQVYFGMWHHPQFIKMDCNTMTAQILGIYEAYKRFGWQGVAYTNHTVYMAPHHEKSLLRIDVATATATFHRISLEGLTGRYGGISVAKGRLYLIPMSSDTNLLVVDLATMKVIHNEPIEQGQGWSESLIFRNMLIAAPDVGSSFLLMDLDTYNFSTADVSFVYRKSRTRPHEAHRHVVEADGKVYSTPCKAHSILILDALHSPNPTVRHKNTDALDSSTECKWSKPTRFGRYLVAAPYFPKVLLMFHLDTEEVYGLPVVPPWSYSDGNEWKYAGAVACGSRLLLYPDGEEQFLAMNASIFNG